MAKKKIILALIIAVLAVLGFILSRDKTIAPTNEKQINMQSEINKIKENPNVSSQPSISQSTDQATQNSAAINNSSNAKPVQLEVKTTQKGTGDRTVKSGDIIGVYYTGKLIDGTIFDSNVGSGKPFEFTVGAGMVIQGWEQGFIGAKVGEKRTLTIPSDLAYGATGQGRIPPNAVLIFDTEIVSIK